MRSNSHPSKSKAAKGKAARSFFLRQNPFPRPFTIGFYYREKMRAIHAITPEGEFSRVLELGGGQSGLTRSLFPNSTILNMDANLTHGYDPHNRQTDVRFICGNAERLPFDDESFDAVTMFDVLEHIPDDRRAVEEAVRVVRQGGAILISTPNPNWRFPFYKAFEPLCPAEAAVMSEWGHVRRGYSLPELRRLFGVPCEANADFINRATVVSHDLAFSKLPGAVRRLGCMLLWPLTWAGYALHGSTTAGTETASCWRKQGIESRGANGR
jgi:SAM-dependent methyltransferase